MKKKAFIYILILLFFLNMAAFLGAVFFKKKARDYLYREISYQFIADSISGKERDKTKIAFLFFDYIHENVNVINAEVFDMTPFDDLVRGVAFCDQQSFELATLLAKKGISSRIAMLRNKDGVSPHTVGEVFLNKRWVVFDPYNGLVFRKNDGALATLDEISKEPSLIAENPIVQTLPNEQKKSFLEVYSTMFPMPMEPVRHKSLLVVKNRNPMQKLSNLLISLSVKFLGKSFARRCQDLYLSLNAKYFNSPQEELYFRARNYHLYCRAEDAENIYRKIIENYPDTKYAEDIQFFLGVLKLKLKLDYSGAIREFDTLFNKYPNTRWAKVVHYFLARSYEGANNPKDAKIHYTYASSDLDTDAVRALYRLFKTTEENIKGN